MSSTFKPKEKELTPPNNDTENIRVVDWLPDSGKRIRILDTK